jgi:Zn-dependent protease with chaperone function
MRVTGLFAWVEYNNTRSIVLLLGFVLLMQPLAAIALALPLIYADAAHAPWFHWGGYAVRYVPVVTLAAGVAFALQMWWHTKTVRRAMGFRFVDDADEPRLCALVEPLAITAGLPTPYVGVIDTPAMNAFACGVTAQSAVVVFTRGLIDGLDDDELSSVIAHELMHIRNGDARLNAAANAFLRNMTFLERFGGWKPRRYREVAFTLMIPALFVVYVTIALLSQLCLRLGFVSRLLISASREFIADAEAVRLTQHPSALLSALQRIQGNSAIFGLPLEQDAMMFDGAAQGRLATHPRIADRIQAIIAVTGQMALDARPRRDTRAPAGAWSGGFGRALPAAANMAAWEHIAVTGRAPGTHTLRAFRDSGDHRLILGLRWDIAVIMVATFLTAVTINRGNLGGVLGQMTHLLGQSGADMAAIASQSTACRMAGLHALAGAKTSDDACQRMGPSIERLMPQLALHDRRNDRLFTETEQATLTPSGEDSPSGLQSLGQGGFMSGGPRAATRPGGPATDLAPSYPVPVHEAWLRLSQGSLGAFIRDRHCGILVHVHQTAVVDQNVTWSITSEGVEQIRLAATVAADGPKATRVTLTIEDAEKTVLWTDSRQPELGPWPVAMRPALMPPLRPFVAEAMTAMLEQRAFDPKRVVPPAGGDESARWTGDVCGSHRTQLETAGRHLSIHDDPGAL